MGLNGVGGQRYPLKIEIFIKRKEFVWSSPRFQAAIVKNDKSFDVKTFYEKKFKGSILIYVY